MIDRIKLSSNENMIIDTLSNNVSIVNLATSKVRIINEDNKIIADLEDWLEIFSLPMNTGKYMLSNISGNDAFLLIVREFIF